MSIRKVYLDFQDGDGYIDVSSYVKYDTLNITLSAFNESYHFSQNSASFSIIYDETLFPKLRYVTDTILVKIFDVIDEFLLATESGSFLLTEDGLYIALESQQITPVFFGHIPLSRSRNYNGILDNTIISLEAIDDIDLLDVEVGDILYANYAIYNPNDTAHSIVHQLAVIAGWSVTELDPTVSIPTVLARFAPQSETDTVKNILDTLLYEYGYALNLDAQGRITPIQWNIPSATPYVVEFNDYNIINNVSIKDALQEYDSVTVSYNELAMAPKIRLYTDDNCGFNSDGTFAGYAVISGYDYPPAANVIDETTGENQIVYQEYTDRGISYATNKAIVNKLDYNYKAFESDFSTIVSTENHFVDRRMDSNITVVAQEFYNKKARLLYRNSSGSPAFLYYNNVYGDVWYRSAERLSVIDLVETPTKVYTYTSGYLFDKASADALTQVLAKQYEIGKTQYSFQCELDIYVGSYVLMNISDGTLQDAVVRERSFDERTGLYTYVCMATSLERGELTSQYVYNKPIVAGSFPFTGSLSTYQINIPYNGTTPDYTNAYTDLTITREGLDVTEDWTIATSQSGVAVSVTGNRISVTSISGLSGSITITASRSGWDDIVLTATVIKAVGEQGESAVVMTSRTTPSGSYVGQLGMWQNRLYKWDGSAWVLADVVGRYLGIGQLSSLTSPTFTSATVTDDGNPPVTGGSITAEDTDWMVNYLDNATFDLALYVWSGTTWSKTAVTRYIDSCQTDIFNLGTSGYAVDGLTVIQNAMIKNLFALNLKLLDTGKLYSGNGNYANADTPTYIGADGNFSLGDKFSFDGTDLQMTGDLSTNDDRCRVGNVGVNISGIMNKSYSGDTVGSGWQYRSRDYVSGSGILGGQAKYTDIYYNGTAVGQGKDIVTQYNINDAYKESSIRIIRTDTYAGHQYRVNDARSEILTQSDCNIFSGPTLPYGMIPAPECTSATLPSTAASSSQQPWLYKTITITGRQFTPTYKGLFSLPVNKAGWKLHVHKVVNAGGTSVLSILDPTGVGIVSIQDVTDANFTLQYFPSFYIYYGSAQSVTSVTLSFTSYYDSNVYLGSP